MKLYNAKAEQQVCKLLETAMNVGFERQACIDIIHASLISFDLEGVNAETLLDFVTRFVASCFNLKEGRNYEWIRQIYGKSYDTFFSDESGELTEHLKDVKPMDIFSALGEYFKPL